MGLGNVCINICGGSFQRVPTSAVQCEETSYALYVMSVPQLNVISILISYEPWEPEPFQSCNCLKYQLWVVVPIL